MAHAKSVVYIHLADGHTLFKVQGQRSLQVTVLGDRQIYDNGTRCFQKIPNYEMVEIRFSWFEIIEFKELFRSIVNLYQIKLHYLYID